MITTPYTCPRLRGSVRLGNILAANNYRSCYNLGELVSSLGQVNVESSKLLGSGASLVKEDHSMYVPFVCYADSYLQ